MPVYKELRRLGPVVYVSRLQNYALTQHAVQPRLGKTQSQATVYLCAGGIGITPLLAMAWELHFANRAFELHVFASSQSAVPFGRDFEALPFCRLIFIHLDSDPPADSQETLFEMMVNIFTDHDQLYLCGPPGFMEVVKREAVDAGFNEEHVFSEHFGAELRFFAILCTFR